MLPVFIFILLFGLIAGSFISAYTERWPKGESVITGRSRCDLCGNKISWFDNIPLLSYLILGGKCRSCGKKISPRYPLIEFFCGFLFLAVSLTYFYPENINLSSSYVLYRDTYGLLFLVLFLITVFLFMSMLIIDLETMYLPDGLIQTGLGMYIFLIIFSEGKFNLYDHLFAGLILSFFLLFLHLLTRGRGMGLGDVKLALLVGIILGLKEGIVWLSLSFIIGASFGVALILMKKTRFGRHIAFGPYLAISFFIMIFFGEYFTETFLPLF